MPTTQTRGSRLPRAPGGSELDLAPTEILDTGAQPGGSVTREAVTAAAGEPPAGARIGAWRVLSRLGQGGMGTVHLVERADGAFEQRAALKLIKPGAWSENFGRRLESERQILADLNHPNIARLLDGGYAADGRPYLVMELIDGLPIDRYCDRERLSIDRRLELFSQVCQAVQHAHRALIVHRDLKPSNVVVDGSGKVTLLDFGIARALKPGGAPVEPLTRAMDQVMTPDYASPEQVRGQPVTTATDVYQLGLLLFELLTGQRAHRIEGPSPVAFVRAVCETPVARPSTVVAPAADPEPAGARSSTPQALARRLRGDLDSIVAVALRKEPERRYGSVAELYDDLDRHRRGLPVQARPDSLSYRLQRFVGRHRQAAAWAALCLALVVWAVVGSARARLRSVREAERVRQVEAVIGSLFEFPRVTGAGGPPRMSDFVDHAAELIRTDLRDQPASQARLMARLGLAYSSLGSYAKSVAAFEEALARVGSAGDPEERSELLYRLGRNQHYVGLFGAAEASFREAARLRGGIFGESDSRTVAINLELVDLLHSLGRLREAEALLGLAIVNLEAAGESRDVRSLRARAHGYLGNVLRDRGALDWAEAAYRTAIAGNLELHGPRDRVTASNEIYFARLLVLRGRFDEAEALLDKQLALLREVHFGEHPQSALALRELGFAAIERGQYELAEERLARSKEISNQWLGPEHPTIPRVTAIKAELERRRGRPAAALEVSEAALDHFARLGLRGHPSALDACITLGLAGTELGRGAEPWVVSHLGECLAAAERELVVGDPRTERLRALAGSGR